MRFHANHSIVFSRGRRSLQKVGPPAASTWLQRVEAALSGTWGVARRRWIGPNAFSWVWRCSVQSVPRSASSWSCWS